MRGGFGLGARARFAGAGGTDFVGGFVAGAFKGAPHVPTGDGAIGAPTLAESEELLGLGHVFLAVGDGPAFLDAEVVDGEDIGAAEAEDQKHFDGPGADAANGDEAFDEFFVGELFGLFEGRDDAFNGFLCEIFHRKNFRAGEAGFAQGGLSELEHFFGRGCAAVGAEGFDAAKDSSGGLAGNGLIGDGFEESFVGGLSVGDVDSEGECFFNEPGETLIGGREVFCCRGEIKRKRGSRAAHG